MVRAMSAATKRHILCGAGLLVVAAMGACSSNSSSPDGAVPVDAATLPDLAVSDDLAAPVDLAVSPEVESAADGMTNSVCAVAFSMSTANLEAAGVPVAGVCTVNRFFLDRGYRILWEITDQQANTLRRLNVTQYPGYAEAGTTFNVLNGEVDVTYTESNLTGESGFWSARKGLLELSSRSGGTYPASGSTFTIQLTDVHFTASGPPGRGTGEFDLNGAITGKLP
jgi:hypothetical protein